MAFKMLGTRELSATIGTEGHGVCCLMFSAYYLMCFAVFLMLAKEITRCKEEMEMLR
jgi:hypothetical protein